MWELYLFKIWQKWVLPAYPHIDSKKKFVSPAIKRNVILTLPQNLIINLKRFSHSYHSYSKNGKRVRFPVILSMDKYTMQEGSQIPLTL